MPKSPTNMTKKVRAVAAPPIRAKAKKTDAQTPMRRENTKQAKLIALLRRPAGATIADLAKATGWQHHTVRGAISGALRKKLGLTVSSIKADGQDRIYRLA